MFNAISYYPFFVTLDHLLYPLPPTRDPSPSASTYHFKCFICNQILKNMIVKGKWFLKKLEQKNLLKQQSFWWTIFTLAYAPWRSQYFCRWFVLLQKLFSRMYVEVIYGKIASSNTKINNETAQRKITLN